jgi:hypothetical protein
MVEKIRRWLSASEIYEHINQLNNSDMMVHLYGLSLFVNEALYTANFELDERWKDYVELSEAGHDLIGVVRKAGLIFPDQHERFALFRIFYHHDLLIDYERTDTEGIVSLLRESHQSESCKWPYFFGNMLYHKFNDICTTNRTDHLDGSAAEKLLDGTPQGIFQIGRLLSGPIGFLESEECRVIEPRLKLALWHCSDPGCMAQHIVELRQHEIDCQTVTKKLIRYIVDNLGPFSEWHISILRFSWKGKWPNGRPYCDISAIIGDCIIGGERASLLLRALKSKHNALLMNEIETARDLRGKPEEVVEQLQPEEQHQLLLLLRDDDLVKYIDELVARKDIRIPPAELREMSRLSLRIS